MVQRSFVDLRFVGPVIAMSLKRSCPAACLKLASSVYANNCSNRKCKNREKKRNTTTVMGTACAPICLATLRAQLALRRTCVASAPMGHVLHTFGAAELAPLAIILSDSMFLKICSSCFAVQHHMMIVRQRDDL